MDPPHGTEAFGGQVIVGGVLSPTVSVTWQVFCVLPGKVRTTFTITDPGLAVVTTTEQLDTFVHELLPTNDAPAVLLSSEKVALKLLAGNAGAFAVYVTFVPHS